MIREKYYNAVLQAGLGRDYMAVRPARFPGAKMQLVTLHLDSWLLCRATRAADNTLAAPAVGSFVWRSGELSI